VVPNYQHVCLKFEKKKNKKVEIIYVKNKFKKIKKTYYLDIFLNKKHKNYVFLKKFLI